MKFLMAWWASNLLRKPAGDDRARRGMALFLVMVILGIGAIVVLYVHFFSRRQQESVRFLTQAEVAYRAAVLGAQQSLLWLKRGLDYCNSSHPDTFPKRTTAPATLRPFLEAVLDSQGRFRSDPPEVEIDFSNSVLQALQQDLGRDLSVTARLSLRGMTPLYDASIFPGLLAGNGEWKGRWVLDIHARYLGTERRLLGVWETRFINLLPPLLGSFILAVAGGRGELNPLLASFDDPVLRVPRLFRSNQPAKPLVLQAGPPLPARGTPQRDSINRDVGTYLDAQGWVFLGTEPPTPPDFWTRGSFFGEEEYGEDFALVGQTGISFPIDQGSDSFGHPVPLRSATLRLWTTHVFMTYPTGMYRESKSLAPQHGTQGFLTQCPEPTDRASIIRLHGTTTSQTPTLIFGQARRRYILLSMLESRPGAATPIPGMVFTGLIPFVLPQNFSDRYLGFPYYDPFTVNVNRIACGNNYDGYAAVMSKVITSADNESLAFVFDRQPNNSAWPDFQCPNIPKLGHGLVYTINQPATMLLSAERAFRRGGTPVFQGRIGDALLNQGAPLICRAGRSFPTGNRLLEFLKRQVTQGQMVAGYYHVAQSFTWTDAFNQFALGGVGIIAEGDITIGAGVQPRTDPGVADAVEHLVVLASLNGNIRIETSRPIHAALLAPRGQVICPTTHAWEVRGLIGCRVLDLDQFATPFQKIVRYDSRFDWLSDQAVIRGQRIMIEHRPRFFLAKPR